MQKAMPLSMWACEWSTIDASKSMVFLCTKCREPFPEGAAEGDGGLWNQQRYGNRSPLLTQFVTSNHQPRHCLLSRLFGRRSKKTSKLRDTGLCAGNSPGTGEFPAQLASNAENVSI